MHQPAICLYCLFALIALVLTAVVHENAATTNPKHSLVHWIMYLQIVIIQIVTVMNLIGFKSFFMNLFTNLFIHFVPLVVMIVASGSSDLVVHQIALVVLKIQEMHHRHPPDTSLVVIDDTVVRA